MAAPLNIIGGRWVEAPGQKTLFEQDEQLTPAQMQVRILELEEKVELIMKVITEN